MTEANDFDFASEFPLFDRTTREMAIRACDSILYALSVSDSIRIVPAHEDGTPLDEDELAKFRAEVDARLAELDDAQASEASAIERANNIL